VSGHDGAAPPAHADEHAITAFRKVPRTGVIYVMAEAQKARLPGSQRRRRRLVQPRPGRAGDGPLPGAPPRCEAVSIAGDDQEYARSPVVGAPRGDRVVLQPGVSARLPSRYSAENVSVSGGGRIALTRAAAALGQVNLGHFLPDYTAYEELLDVFRLFSPIPILLEPSAATRSRSAT